MTWASRAAVHAAAECTPSRRVRPIPVSVSEFRLRPHRPALRCRAR
jgi:hypothetical protein